MRAEPRTADQKVHQAFTPSPLQPAQIEALYVNMDDVRGHGQPVFRLAKRIESAVAGERTCQLLAGHRGSGKSTELARLRRILEDEQQCFVVSFSADEGLDRNDVDVPDLLLAIARVICEQVNDRLNAPLAAKPLEKYFAGIKTLLKAQFHLTSAKIKASFVELSADIKLSHVYRQAVRSQVAPAMRELLAALNDLIGEAALAVNRHDGTKLVLMVDDLDKLSALSTAAGGATQPERLFVDGAQELTSLDCHVIYTIPVELAYSHHQGALSARYGGHLPVLPMVRVQPRQRGASLDSEAERGREFLREVARRRLRQVQVAEDEVFEPGILDRLIAFSGGQPDELMNLVRHAAVIPGLPISEAGARHAEVNSRRTNFRMLMAEHTPLLEEVRDRGTLTRTAANERYWRELLSSRAVLLYANDEDWYGLNPALEGVTFPRPPAPAP